MIIRFLHCSVQDIPADEYRWFADPWTYWSTYFHKHVLFILMIQGLFRILHALQRRHCLQAGSPCGFSEVHLKNSHETFTHELQWTIYIYDLLYIIYIYIYTWTLDPVEIFTYVQNKFFFSTNGWIFVFYDCLRSGLLGRIEVISRKFSNLGIRSEYVLFAFNLRSFCILLHSGVNQTWYIHTIPGGKGRKYPYPTIFSVQRRKFFNLERISSFFHYKWKFHRDWGSRYSSHMTSWLSKLSKLRGAHGERYVLAPLKKSNFFAKAKRKSEARDSAELWDAHVSCMFRMPKCMLFLRDFPYNTVDGH